MSRDSYLEAPSTLEMRVEEMYQNCALGNDKVFLPAGEYQHLVTKDAIRENLGLNRMSQEDEALLDFILNRAVRVFLTFCLLCQINFQQGSRNKFLKACHRYGFDDGWLPVEAKTLKTNRPFGPNFDQSAGFCHTQYRYLTPVFSNARFVFGLEQGHLLPFTECIQRYTHGMSCIVSEAVIHGDHLEDPPLDFRGRIRHIALKRIGLGGGNGAAGVEDFRAQFDNELLGAFTKDHTGYLMFLWADGGNLREFWSAVDPLQLNSEEVRHLVREFLNRFRGLSDGLAKLHVHKKYRHGDVKPENTLRFLDGTTRTGTLLIADFGLAKQHSNPTAAQGPTTSLGCVMLEHVAWLLYGSFEIGQFQNDLAHNPKGGFHTKAADFTFVLRPQVLNLMEDISKNPNSAPGTALGDILRCIADHLLVFTIPDNWGEAEEALAGTANLRAGTRASATELRCLLDEIIKNTNSRGRHCLFRGGQRVSRERGAPTAFPVRQKNPTLTPNADAPGPAASHDSHRSPVPLQQPCRSRKAMTNISLSKASPWEQDPRMYQGSNFHSQNLKPQWTHDRKFGFTDVVMKTALVQTPAIRLTNEQMNKTWDFSIDDEVAPKLLTILGMAAMFPESLHEAAPLCRSCERLKFGDPGFSFGYKCDGIKRRAVKCGLCKMLWGICERHCKTAQTDVKFVRYQSTLRLDDGVDPVLSLISSPHLKTATPLQLGFPKVPRSGSDTHFAIIRQWLECCDSSHPACGSGNRVILPTRLIDVGSPGSTKIRLVETRESGQWLDSLEYVALSHPWGTPPHFCTFPDDPNDPLANNTLSQYRNGIKVSILPATFQDAVHVTRALQKHYLWIDSLCVLQGPRGDFADEAKRMEDVYSSAYCVLAASSASNQTDGFLGDSSFPSLALSGNRGEEIRWYQELYAQYSRLGMSRDSGRRMAIRGLESRLIAAFARKHGAGFRGGLGVLDDGPGGGLLWRRGHGEPALEPIAFPQGREGAPSWSWMACRGAIDFVQVAGGTVEWEATDLKLAWSSMQLVVRARDLRQDGATLGGSREPARLLVWDDPGKASSHGVKRNSHASNKIEFTLLVGQLEADGQMKAMWIDERGG
ncbi:hypothetical protein B0T26DRAFT_679289 [Lasiosphaeria miniovina]|uniref:Protein kinase domain-containing protein n=1 Tax=Lasiosphaeria miniovina TaxID=1954250 RepID=A0AA40A5X8_9PEZI|nr:uncharacterized protein B0T26DRAFT_679289 [Lasiosphaeria miniovina]KAK0709943.1 hypothetical protein B0T26DRAFT_679289 [Lasiosphaeria miniovina]